MELMTIIFSGLLSILANGGWLVDWVAQKQLNSYVKSAETLVIRADNTPNYRLAQGSLESLRIAGRGVYLEPNLRIASLELETDAIALKPQQLSSNSLEKLRASLKKPLQGAFSLVITQEDLTKALQSEQLQAKLQSTLNQIIARKAGVSAIAYELFTPRLEFQGNNVVTFEVNLRREGETLRANQAQELAIALTLELEVIQGKKIQLTKLDGTVNNRPLSSRLLKGFAEGISNRLDLTTIESQGIFARLLQLEIAEDKIEIVGFARMETKSIPVGSMIEP